MQIDIFPRESNQSKCDKSLPVCFYHLDIADPDVAWVVPDPKWFRRRALLVAVIGIPITVVLAAVFSSVGLFGLLLLFVAAAFGGYWFAARHAHKLWRILRLDSTTRRIEIFDPGSRFREVDVECLVLRRGKRYARKNLPVGTYQAFQFIAVTRDGDEDCLLQTGAEGRLRRLVADISTFLKVPLEHRCAL